MKQEFNDRKKADEVFSDDFLSDRRIGENSFEHELTDDDLRFSRELLGAINSSKAIFNSEDKDFLATRIVGSIEKSKRRELLKRISYAASLLVVVSLSFYFITANRKDIVGYAAGISVDKSLSSTQLLLPHGKSITIESPESTISYSKNGNTVVIDAHKEVSQINEGAAVEYNTVVVPYGKRSQVTLSDKSTIWLNSGSRLVYPARFSTEKREVYLEGEALFVIAHNENIPFHVLTKNVEVKVLGTVFDLSAYDEDSMVNTILEKGSVEVIYNKNLFGSSKSKMEPGKLASFSVTEKSISMQDVNTKDFTSWKDGYLTFEKKSLESITRRLSRYYNVTIEFEDPELAKETFSGYLDLRNSAVQVLGMISEMMDIEIIQTTKGIKISKKGSSV